MLVYFNDVENNEVLFAYGNTFFLFMVYYLRFVQIMSNFSVLSLSGSLTLGKKQVALRKNQTLQGSVLAPTVFSIYTNDQPNSPSTTCFLHADDLDLTTQKSIFKEAEANTTAALVELGTHYMQTVSGPTLKNSDVCFPSTQSPSQPNSEHHLTRRPHPTRVFPKNI